LLIIFLMEQVLQLKLTQLFRTTTTQKSSKIDGTAN
jgi:hypothetical protein